jgi:plastocyanin
MRKIIAAAGVAASLMGLAGCGGYGGSPIAPNGQSSPPAGTVVIEIVGENGSRSFSPNPATLPAGQSVSWHNNDSTTHHVLLNNGALDTGNLGPGQFSAAMTLGQTGPYHCTIHPDMVGTLTSGQ